MVDLNIFDEGVFKYVRCIVYYQGIIKCRTRKLNKAIEKVFMEN
jgi:hypothetical protein